MVLRWVATLSMPPLRLHGVGKGKDRQMTDQTSQQDREAFEAHIRTISPKRLFIERWPNGSYRHIEIEEMWKGFQVGLKHAQQAVEPFQQRVQPWMMECFGPEIAADAQERNHRFLEESLELVQACGCTQSEAHQLVDYVYGRPVGDKHQEAGGVMVTLAALCLAQGLDMHQAGETELARIWTKVEKIRAKQAAKPKHSPLPMAVEIGPERCPTCGMRHRTVAPDSPLAKAHRAAVVSDLTDDQIRAMLPQIGAILPSRNSGKVELRPLEYRNALQSYAIRAIRALKQQPAQADKPRDCSNDPSSCPDNEGRGCYCTDNKLLPCPGAQADKELS